MPDLHPLAHGFADVADQYELGRPGYPVEAVDALALPAGARVTAITHVQQSSRALLVANIASISYVAILPPAERAALLERVDALLARHRVEDLDLPLRTEIWTARRLQGGG
jgi:hypothetical protein